ncbi:hypothetical protein AB0I61_18765 [Polymorphospora rubra]|uniref:hypothetical protein n=1 Tax=Polymorphospora rubra TaxID=338584 RepID=UPI0033E37200
MRYCDQRWRLLLPPGTVVVDAERRDRALRELRELPPGTPVALLGRRLRPLARRAGVRPQVEYVALPSLAAPLAVTQVTLPALRWTARMLTVPSGVTLWHAPMWAAVRLVRAAPRLLRFAPTGERLLVGATRASSSPRVAPAQREAPEAGVDQGDVSDNPGHDHDNNSLINGETGESEGSEGAVTERSEGTVRQRSQNGAAERSEGAP